MAKARVFLATILAMWISGCSSQPIAVTQDGNRKQQSTPQETGVPSLLPVRPSSSTGGFDGSRAFEHVRHLVELGPRPPGSDAIHQAQSYIVEQLKGYGCRVEEHDFHASTPIGDLAMKNIIAKILGTEPGVILFATHYDTVRLPNFVGADDGGSGTGTMLELARVLCSRKSKLNTWIVFFDGEEAQGKWADKSSIQWTKTNNTLGSREMAASMALSGELKEVKAIYDLLFRASAETLLEVARDPRHLGAEIGFFSVLHTWNQKLGLHPHVHCVIPAGGLSLDHTRWIRSPYRFFLPIKVLSRVYRGKFVAGLKQAVQDGRFRLHGNLALLAEPKIFAAWLRPLFRKDWVVYAKPPFGGPQHVLQYLAVTLIAWPSPTIAWCPLRMAKLSFAGAIQPTTTNRSSCLYLSMSSCAASCCICCLRVLCASETLASWPTADAPRGCRFVFTCSGRDQIHQLNQTPPPLMNPPIFGAAPSVMAQ